ncbi:MAG: hypothetical protein U9P61_00200 [Patescibacteria group bacterium]|nr:hypothetical protein [Patescibacteria group bacterium]
MNKNTKKTIFIVLIILIAVSFFCLRITKNVVIDSGNKSEEEVEEIEEVSEIEYNEQEENIKEENLGHKDQEPTSIELKKPPFIN